MNKQQLANKIWATAQKMRSSKIEAQQYKDYLLGFIFYKFLSSHEVNYLKKQLGMTDEQLKDPTLFDKETIEFCKNRIGYFIHPKHLYSTWLAKGSEFSVKDVSQAFSAFRRNINPTYNHVYKDIFKALDSGFSDFGETTGSMTKAISELLNLIKDIPTDGRQGYDVLGFIYEYLIGKFAASAGKKAGEYYTPHEVSVLMSEIVAEHLKGRDSIKIYDPTSGSGSLLLTIGRAVEKHMMGKDTVDYYAQEWIDSTYNLTRMNLVMREVKPAQINVRNADTLAADWPLEKGKQKPLRVDAVVSNPPYSQGWDPKSMKNNPRFSYGLAPKGKADYAFLLHSLYHLDNDGIMTIVLPTGVLSRGDEYEIRRNLIEHGHIKTVIALPANIFYGTNIPTIIMVLCQKRRQGEADDVLFVDASNCFVKQGTKNILRTSDIKRIADAVCNRENIPHFAYLASKKEVAEDNDYNLHIPRYVASADRTEPQDLYAHIYGGIPNEEIAAMEEYWQAFPTLQGKLFEQSGDTPYSKVVGTNVTECVENNAEIANFKKSYHNAFQGLDQQLYGVLIDRIIDRNKEINADAELSLLTSNIFERIAPFALIDKYKVYQTLSDHWNGIATDIEIIQTEGFEATRQVDEVVEVTIDKNGKEDEKHKGWAGHVVPFNLVQQYLLKDEADKLQQTINQLEQITMEFAEMKDELTPEEQERYLTEDRDGYDMSCVEKDYKAALADIDTPDINTLKGYIELLDAGGRKAEKIGYIEAHKDLNWSQMPQNSQGAYNKGDAQHLLFVLQSSYEFEEDTTAFRLSRIWSLYSRQKETEHEIKLLNYNLEEHTIRTIKSLTDEQVLELLRRKWIEPLCHELKMAPDAIVLRIIQQVDGLEKKYADTLHQINTEIADAEALLSDMLGRLRGNKYDMAAIAELQATMKGDKTGESAKLLKDICYDSMLPRDGKRVPEVRFEGYDGEWEEEDIATAFRILKNNTYPRADLNYISGSIKNVHYGDVLIKFGACIDTRKERLPFITSEENAKRVASSILNEGDIIVADTAEDEAVGKCSEIINLNGEKVVSGLHTIPLRPTKEFSYGFMGYFMNTSSFHNQLLPYMQGSKVLAISRTAIKEVPVRYPSVDSEQHDIAVFFTTLDKLIGLRARQLEKLKALKSGCFQKMFV